MESLRGKVALVAGASRGAGRGIAVALGEAGATVYVVARTSRGGPKPADNAPGSVEDTAEEVTARGGKGIAIRADLGDEKQVIENFKQIGHLDVLANAAWGPNCMAAWSKTFWDLDAALWQDTLATVSTCWWTSVYAARLMAKQGAGLIVHVTDDYPDSKGWRGHVLHDTGHECIDRLIMGMHPDAEKAKIAVVGLNPGFMRTERVQMHMKTTAAREEFRYDLSESPEYIGRGVVALAADPNVIQKAGQLLWVADLAKEYGFTDIDGRLVPRFDPKAPRQECPW
jgi:NAD(P)-dependent dehydrogenase (short-subunit alcohol dehydrogenase family)